MKKIQELLDEKLTGKQLKELHSLLGLNLKQLTRRFSGNSAWGLPEMQKLSELIDIPVKSLIIEYGLGADSISYHSVNQLLIPYGTQLGEVAHAA